MNIRTEALREEIQLSIELKAYELSLEIVNSLINRLPEKDRDE